MQHRGDLVRVFGGCSLVAAVGPLAGLALADAFPAGGPAQWLAIAAAALLLRFSPPLHGLTVPASAAELQQRFAALFAEFIPDDEVPAESDDGIYEQDAFYRACDQQGVLIWQDFMFARTDYPQSDPALAAEVAREAEYQVKRLRNHPSLALWCGNNEVQALHGATYQNYEPGDWGHDFFYRVLPEAVAEFDGRTPYWPGSPWGEDPSEGWAAANGVLDGDRHAREVWHGISFGPDDRIYDNPGDARHYRRYADDKGKFISEFGIHAAPELATRRRCLPQDQLHVHSDSFDHHNKDNPKNKHDAVLAIVTGLPETIEQYVAGVGGDVLEVVGGSAACDAGCPAGSSGLRPPFRPRR